MSRTLETEAVVLRTLRYGEADRILHLFTKGYGRVGAIAKGARRTRSRLGARLEQFSHVRVRLHQGRGELATVTGVDLVRSHQGLAASQSRLAVAQIGAEATLRLFLDHDPSPEAFNALVRLLDLLEAQEGGDEAPGLDPLGLSFQLKLVWLAGFLPHLASCAACGSKEPLAAFSARAGGAVCAECATASIAVSPQGLTALRALLERPLAEARAAGTDPRAAREVLRVIEAVYEEHGGFRLRTLARR